MKKMKGKGGFRKLMDNVRNIKNNQDIVPFGGS
jgi:hypothetical protein